MIGLRNPLKNNVKMHWKRFVEKYIIDQISYTAETFVILYSI